MINFANEKLGLFVEDCTNKLNLVLLNINIGKYEFSLFVSLLVMSSTINYTPLGYSVKVLTEIMFCFFDFYQ